jgi:hypothetical protein
MGLVSPVILHGKMLLQEMWESGIDWDTKITDEHVLDNNRVLFSQDKYVKYNLLCFCDSS